MEKTVKIGMLVLFMSFLYSSCTTRTPEAILERQFNITLKDFDYQVETFDEQWNPNGDGYAYIVFKFNALTENNINYFLSSGLKKLPIPDGREIPDRFLFDNGYYLFEKVDSNDERDFKLFVVDTENNKAILYYQYM